MQYVDFVVRFQISHPVQHFTFLFRQILQDGKQPPPNPNKRKLPAADGAVYGTGVLIPQSAFLWPHPQGVGRTRFVELRVFFLSAHHWGFQQRSGKVV